MARVDTFLLTSFSSGAKTKKLSLASRQKWRAAVEQAYDLFEVQPDGVKLWRMAICGLEPALLALEILGRETHHECFAANLSTHAVIGRVNHSRAADD